ncbi:PIN domain-containing protein [candidate division KSB1 bacterium]|nr:PIN domain-containing protein [candidate division KSB1 bacterium]
MNNSDNVSIIDHYPIVAIPPFVYDEKRQQAEVLIAHRDPKDVDILALTLKLDIPLWTNDRDFDNIHEIKTFTTAELLEKLNTLRD